MKRPVIIALLIVALALVCVGIVSVAFFRMNGFATNNPFDRQNIPSALEENQTLKVDAEEPITLIVNSAAGEVTVTGGDVETVQLEVVKTAYDSTQARADEEVKTIKYTVEQKGNSITLNYELSKSMNFSNNINTVDFNITVPTGTAVDVDTSKGKVTIKNIQGEVVVADDFGNIEIDQVTGSVQVETSSGQIELTSVRAGTEDIDLFSGFGSITLDQVTGANLKVELNSGAIELENVRATKKLELSTNFGFVSFETGSAGTMDVHTSSGAVTLNSITVGGSLTIQDDFGDITLEQVKAESYDARTNSGAIRIDGAGGNIKAHTGFGNIDIQNGENATLDLDTKSGSIDFSGSLGLGPHTVHSDFGEIELNIPADTALNVTVETKFGEIMSDIPITVTITGNITDTQRSGTMNGGGAELKMDTNSGNITIRALSE